jgi:hypothetical protein
MAAVPLLLLMASLMSPDSAQAQVFTPAYLAPRSEADVGVYLNGHRGGLSLEGVWRRRLAAYDLGLRAGLTDLGEGSGLLIGADYRNPLALAADPLLVAATGGAQAYIGESGGFGVHAGLSVGGELPIDEVPLIVYLHPRLALGGGDWRGGAGLALLADLGVDAEIRPGLSLRVNFGFGAPVANWGIGLAWR